METCPDAENGREPRRPSISGLWRAPETVMGSILSLLLVGPTFLSFVEFIEHRTFFKTSSCLMENCPDAESGLRRRPTWATRAAKKK